MAEAAKQKRTIIKGQFTRAEKRLKDSLKLPLNVPLSTIQRRFEDLKSKWNEIQEAHDLYMSQLEEVTEEEEKWMDEIIERFDALEIEADNIVGKSNESTKMTNASIQSEQNVKDQNNSNVQLERIKLEQFNGDIRKYPKFKEQFELYVKPLCRASQLPFILRSYLTDDVKEEVDNLDDNLDTLWRRLDKKYGNCGKLVDAILADLSRIPKGDGKQTLQLIKTVERAYRDLARMGRSSEMQNGTIIAMIERKLPEEIRFEWIKIVADLEGEEESEEKFKLLFDLLENWKVRLEYDQALIRKVPEKKSVTHHASAKTSQEREPRQEKERCWIHTQEYHPIWVCNIFKGKDISERLQLAKENSACLACLEVNCPGASDPINCRRKFTCTKDDCNEAHNSLLHQ